MLLKSVSRVRSVGAKSYSTISNPIVLPPLPYDRTALEPHISGETIDYHYGKHHAGYVTKINTTLTNTAERDLVKLMKSLKGTDQKNFNLAAQIWNHTFYWNSMKPNGGGDATGKIAAEIEKNFGNYKEFKDQFTNAAINQFGSGWAWLAKDPKTGQLKIVTTSNAECPITEGLVPLVTCDVWEHAYYIQHRHLRAQYVDSWWKLINWEFANQNLTLN
eukprot:TRINITY_DN8148_c0_g1_i1.p1 TRINITY_DN8148_c0_g1~~TRINITY_DN8148_c0_g1_i1.p1  ORF type:complete len:218 (-),score=47.95 TRINITY_DN8148_c0_g1_i1:36-689(-)